MSKPRNWAEDDSSDEEFDVEEMKKKMEPIKILSQNNENKIESQQYDSDEDEESEEESDVDEDEDELKPIPSAAPKPAEIKKPVVPLSKKEKKMLKEKELQDLESLLAEMGVAPESKEINDVPPTKMEDTVVESTNATEESKKKNKKKKKAASSTTAATTTSDAGTAEVESKGTEESVVVDVSQVLKNKLKPKKSSSSTKDTTKLAISEAMKESRSVDKKKSKDKKNYNEFSY